jgi:hypothetical protein
MKKLLICAFLFLGSTLSALPLGNPAEPGIYKRGAFLCGGNNNLCDPCFNWCDAFSLRIGFYGDYVFNRGLKIVKEPNPLIKGSDFDEYQIFTNAGYIALNFINRLDVFTTLGETTTKIKSNLTGLAPGLLGEGELIQSPHFSWSVGSRALLFSWRCFDFGLEGQYFHRTIKTSHEIDYSTGLVAFRDISPGSYREWQVGGGVSLTFATPCNDVKLIPYVGAKGAWLKRTILGGQAEDRAPRHWGFATGMTLAVLEAAGVTVEGRFGDEKAISVLGEFRF